MADVLHSKPKYRLENWSTNYTKQLIGNVYGNPRFKDGENIITSYIISLDLDKMEVETKNSIYILGNIDKYYMKHLIAKDLKNL